MLGLLTVTNASWVDVATRDVPRLLVDHAHCELKAASNALSLSVRCVEHPPAVRALAAIAEEELRHYRRVLDVMDVRRVAFGPPEEDWYAAELRRRSAGRRGGKKREDRSPGEIDDILVDRFLVAALIEARSCERFKLLAAGLAAHDRELADFYAELFADEARHHRTFFDLAVGVAGQDEPRVRSRLATLAQIEAEIADGLGRVAAIHG